MLVFWKERLAFLAVPKTGTTAIEGALLTRASLVLRQTPQLKHMPLVGFRTAVVPVLEAAGGRDFETMAVLRHPVSWLGSWYRYRSRDDLAGKPNSTRGVSFDDFVREYAKAEPRSFANVGSQSRFVRTIKGRIAVDHLYRYEEVGRAVAFLERRLGTTLRLPQANVSPAMELTLSPDAEAALVAAKPEEFEAWEAARGG